MIYFWDNLVECAKKLIEISSTKEDLKAKKCISDIYNMIHQLQMNSEHIDSAIQLDNKLNEEYPVIKNMQNIGTSMSKQGCFNVREKSVVDIVIDNLNADKYGIYLDILIKHEVIRNIEDFIKCID